MQKNESGGLGKSSQLALERMGEYGAAKEDGVPILGFTWYSLIDQVDWAALRRQRQRQPLGLSTSTGKSAPSAGIQRLVQQWREFFPPRAFVSTTINNTKARPQIEPSGLLRGRKLGWGQLQNFDTGGKMEGYLTALAPAAAARELRGRVAIRINVTQRALSFAAHPAGIILV